MSVTATGASRTPGGQEAPEEEDQWRFAIEGAELGTWDYNPATDRFTANDRLKQWFGLDLADNEIGFDQENADKIFDVFTRLHSKDKFEGTGLGLALCKKIAERHGGFIGATSNKKRRRCLHRPFTVKATGYKYLITSV